MHSQRGTRPTSRNSHVPSRAQTDEYTQLLKDILNEKRSKDYAKSTIDQMEDTHRLNNCIDRLAKINDLQAQRLSNPGRRPSAASRRLKLCSSQVVKVIAMFLPISKIRSEVARSFLLMFDQNDILARLRQSTFRRLVSAFGYIQRAGVISVAACYVLKICNASSSASETSPTSLVEDSAPVSAIELGCLRSFIIQLGNGTMAEYIIPYQV